MLQVMSLQGWSSLAKLERIEHPVLVVTGDDDPLMPPANGYIMARCMRNARLHVPDGATVLGPVAALFANVR